MRLTISQNFRKGKKFRDAKSNYNQIGLTATKTMRKPHGQINIDPLRSVAEQIREAVDFYGPSVKFGPLWLEISVRGREFGVHAGVCGIQRSAAGRYSTSHVIIHVTELVSHLEQVSSAYYKAIPIPRQ